MTFWTALDELVAAAEIVIDRPRHTAHPHYDDLVYPVDYGYLAGTMAADGGGIDVWVGSDSAGVVGIITTLDSVQRDAEINILVGCTAAEIEAILTFFQVTQMGYLPVLRETTPYR